MSADIYVSFGANTEELEAGLALANAGVKDFGRQMRAVADDMHATGASADSDLGRKLVALGREMAEARENAGKMKEKLKDATTVEGGEEHNSFIKDLREGLEAAVRPLNELKVSFREMIELYAEAFAVEKVIDWASETAEAMEKIENEAHKLGTSVESVENLQAVSRLTGVNYDEMASQLERMQLQLTRVGEKASPAAAALKALGISVAEFRAANADKQFDLMAEAASRFADGGQKTAAIEALLGRAGANMIPALDKGREGLDELRETARRTGVVLSGEAVAAMAKTSDSISELGLSLTALSENAFAAVNSAVNGFTVTLATLVEEINRSVNSGGLFAAAFQAVGWTLRQIAQYIAETIEIIESLDAAGDTATRELEQAFSTFGHVVADVFQALGAALPNFFVGLVTAGAQAVAAVEKQFVDLGAVILDTLHMNFAGAKAAFGAMGTDAADAVGKIGGAFKGVFDFSAVDADAEKGMDALAVIVAEGNARVAELARQGQREYNAIWGLGGDSEAKGAKPQVPQMNIGGAASKAAAQAAEQAFSDAVAAARQAAQQTEDTLNGELQTHKIVMSEWLAQTKAALDGEASAIKAAAAQALASAALTSAQKRKIAHEEAADLARIAHQETEDQNKAALAAQKVWMTAAGQIESAWNSQLRSVLSGTETFGQAMRKVLQDVVIQGIEWFEKLAINFVLQETVMNSAATTGAALRLAANEAGSAGGIAGLLSSAFRAVTAYAGETFGGVAAFLSPVMGPAALGPAAAASAAVISAGSVASADIGMWSVPHDMLSLVHHNELIMPAAQASAFRDMLSGGGGGQGGGVSIAPTTHFHKQALDRAGVAQFFRDNQRDMLHAINGAVRQGAHLGLSRLRTA